MGPLWPPVVLLTVLLSQPLQVLYLCSLGLLLVRREFERAAKFLSNAHLLAQPGSHNAGILPPCTHF